MSQLRVRPTPVRDGSVIIPSPVRIPHAIGVAWRDYHCMAASHTLTTSVRPTSHVPRLRSPEQFVALGQIVLVRPMLLTSRQLQEPRLHLLEAVLQHRAINLRQNFFPNVNAIVGRD